MGHGAAERDVSAALTQAQRDRLASRDVRVLRVLILDMVGAAEAAALASLYSDPAVTSAAWHAVDSAMLHAHTALALYVGNDVSMLYAWDSVEDAFDDRAALVTWRARLAAALAIPEAPVERMRLFDYCGSKVSGSQYGCLLESGHDGDCSDAPTGALRDVS